MCQIRVSSYFVVLSIAVLLGSVEVARSTTLDTDPNLAGWWKFDETTGKIAADASAHKRKATLKEDVSFDENSGPGKVGKAIELDGDEAWIEVPDYRGVTGTHCRTVAAWIKTDTTRGQIFSWGTDDFGKMWNFGFVRGRVGVTPNGGYLYMNAPTHDDKWHHVAAVVREAELPNLHDDVTLYLDGTVAEIHDIGLLDLWPLETGDDMNVRIGRRFKGCLDDLRIYDRALSEEEVRVLFKLQSDRPTPKPKN